MIGITLKIKLVLVLASSSSTNMIQIGFSTAQAANANIRFFASIRVQVECVSFIVSSPLIRMQAKLF